MTFIESVIAFLISLFASVIGAICGIGGGVIIKPALDLFGVADVSTVSFLSCCTVLAMCCYSVLRMLKSDVKINIKISTPLAIGASVGGVAGSLLFKAIKSMLDDPDAVGAAQAVCLAVITAGTLVYTLFKSKISPLNITAVPISLLIGIFLGIVSSFLGIGGGPINLVVLFFFFGMETKTAAANSLYIILFSQVANLITTLIGGAPQFEWHALLLMISGGIIGGVLGRFINRKIQSKSVDRLFIALMSLIIIISIYNALKYSI